MARRWPLLSASVVLLVATLSAPPARALDEPERLRLVGERAFADGLYPLARRVLERFVAEYPNAARPRGVVRPRVERPGARAARDGDRGAARAARPVAGPRAGPVGDAPPGPHPRRAEALRRRPAVPRGLRHEVPEPQAAPGRAVPLGLGAREVGRHEGGARQPARVRRRGAEPRAGAGGAPDDHGDDHAPRRPERARGRLQDADGRDAADARGALRRGLDRGPT